MPYMENNIYLTRPFKILWQTDYFEVINIFFINRETNLKCRQPLPETGELGDDEEQLSQVKRKSLTLPQVLQLSSYNTSTKQSSKLHTSIVIILLLMIVSKLMEIVTIWKWLFFC